MLFFAFAFFVLGNIFLYVDRQKNRSYSTEIVDKDAFKKHFGSPLSDLVHMGIVRVRSEDSFRPFNFLRFLSHGIAAIFLLASIIIGATGCSASRVLDNSYILVQDSLGGWHIECHHVDKYDAKKNR